MITPEEFMTQPEPDDLDEDVELLASWVADEVPTPDPLESIAESLRVVASSLTDQHDEALQAAREEYADLEAKHEALFGLLADVEKIIAPSTSKLANNVRGAITRWRNPVVEIAPEPEPAQVVLGQIGEHNNDHDAPPAADADVEEWRAYARSRGYTGHDVATGNRAQIRTMLGLEQPVVGDEVQA